MLSLSATSLLHFMFLTDFSGKKAIQRRKDISFVSRYMANSNKDSSSSNLSERQLRIIENPKKSWFILRTENFLFKCIPCLLIADRALRLKLPPKITYGAACLPLVAESIAIGVDLMSIYFFKESQYFAYFRDFTCSISQAKESIAWVGLTFLNIKLVNKEKAMNLGSITEVCCMASAVLTGINSLSKPVVPIYSSLDDSLKNEQTLSGKPLNEKPLEESKKGKESEKGKEKEEVGSELEKKIRLIIDNFNQPKNVNNKSSEEMDFYEEQQMKISCFKELCALKSQITDAKTTSGRLFKTELTKAFQSLWNKLLPSGIKNSEEEFINLTSDQLDLLCSLLSEAQEAEEFLDPDIVNELLGEGAKKKFSVVVDDFFKVENFGFTGRMIELIEKWEKLFSPGGRKKEELSPFAPILSKHLSDRMQEYKILILDDPVRCAYTLRTLLTLQGDKEDLLTKVLDKFKVCAEILVTNRSHHSSWLDMLSLFIALKVLKPVVNSDADLKAKGEGLIQEIEDILFENFLSFFPFDEGKNAKNNTLNLIELASKTSEFFNGMINHKTLRIEEFEKQSYFSVIEEIYKASDSTVISKENFKKIKAVVSGLSRLQGVYFKLDPNFEFGDEDLDSSDTPIFNELKQWIRQGFYPVKDPVMQLVDLEGILESIQSDEDKKSIIKDVLSLINAFKKALEEEKAESLEELESYLKRKFIENGGFTCLFNILKDHHLKISSDEKKALLLFLVEILVVEGSNYLKTKSCDAEVLQWLSKIKNSGMGAISHLIHFSESELDPGFSNAITDRVNYLQFILNLKTSKDYFNQVFDFVENYGAGWIFMDPAWKGNYEFKRDVYNDETKHGIEYDLAKKSYDKYANELKAKKKNILYKILATLSEEDTHQKSILRISSGV